MATLAAIAAKPGATNIGLLNISYVHFARSARIYRARVLKAGFHLRKVWNIQYSPIKSMELLDFGAQGRN
jgi:hypothetical protein